VNAPITRVIPLIELAPVREISPGKKCLNWTKRGGNDLKQEESNKANYLKKNKQNQPGVDVMITFFCDFCQFSAKKIAFFSKTNVMIHFLHNLALF
jgi:hypothetical protein